MSGLSLQDTVLVKNVAPPGHKYGELTIFHGPLIRHTIKSGDQTYVPYFIAKNWFGDVRSGDKVSTHLEATDVGPRQAVIPTREFEVNRLHSHYGLHTGPSDKFDPKDVPQVELYDIEGNRVPTVLEDPEGKNVIEAKTTVSQMDAMAEQLRLLQARLNQLEEERGSQMELPPPDDGEDHLDDLPDEDKTLPIDDIQA